MDAGTFPFRMPNRICRMNTYHELVEQFASALKDGKQIPLGGFDPLPRPNLPENAPKILIFSPHPDDEAIIGALPLRLMRESGMRVINVAVTQGSNRDLISSGLAVRLQADSHGE